MSHQSSPDSEVKHQTKAPRKRRFDDDDGPSSKRNNADEVLFKLMLPSSAVGAVIGKGGEMIAKLQEDNGIKMLVSKVHDTYPGTKERVCRISGPIPGVLHVLRFILSDGYGKVEKNEPRDIYDNSHYDRNKQVKMIIPHGSAGVVIGKAGEGIKEMHDATGAYLDVSKRDREPQLPERVVTYAGDHEQLIACTELLLERLSHDKNSTTHQNVSYVDLKQISLEEARRSSASMPPRSGGHGGGHGHGLQMRGDYDLGGGPPTTDLFGTHAFDRDLMARNVAETRAAQVQSSMAAAAAYRASAAAAANASIGLSSSAVDPYSSRSAGSAPYEEVPVQLLRQATSDGMVGFLSNIGPALRAAGYGENSIAEVRNAMQTLAKHNVLGLGLGFGLASIGHQPRHREPSPETHRMSGVRELIADAGSGYGGRYASSGPVVSERPDIYASRSASVYERNGTERRDPGALVQKTSDYDYMRQSSSGGFDYDKLTAALRSVAKEESGSSGGGAGTISVSVEVPETLIGVVLGRGGSTLQELQRYSGSYMDVSKKGDVAPGTDNRVVKIQGTPEAVAVGKRLVERRVLEEKMQREARNASGGQRSTYG